MQPNERHTVYAASGRPYRLPIDAAQFRSLLLYVDEMCALHGCDNTLTTRAHLGPSQRCRRGRACRGACAVSVGSVTARSA